MTTCTYFGPCRISLCHAQLVDKKVQVQTIVESILTRDALVHLRHGVLNFATDYPRVTVLFVNVRTNPHARTCSRPSSPTILPSSILPPLASQPFHPSLPEG